MMKKSLRDYMVRFNNESLQDKDRDNKVIITTFINGLKLLKLYTEFIDKPLRTIRKMLDQPHERANVEEAYHQKSEQKK